MLIKYIVVCYCVKVFIEEGVRGHCMKVLYGSVVVALINLIIVLVLFSIIIYGFVLFVKLANRGIKALDIYINEKTNNKL